MFKLGIPILSKGGTNHLHRPEFVEALHRRDIAVTFFVRDDYLEFLDRMVGCSYEACSWTNPTGWRGQLAEIARWIRFLYPSTDQGKRDRLRLVNENQPLRIRAGNAFYGLIARYKCLMRLLTSCEKHLYGPDLVKGVDPRSIDQLLMLGFGGGGTEGEGVFSHWARQHNIPVVHIVGNYDNLSSKGFRGVDIDQLLVWGPSMREDATRLHGIPKNRIHEVGSVRYSKVLEETQVNRDTFLSSLGLDPNKKTILFAGAMYEYHYFEMVQVLRKLQSMGHDTQLVLRIYPTKFLLNSSFMPILYHYAQNAPDIYISHGDPLQGHGSKDKEVLSIEEYELWNAIAASDVVINIFSSIALEACMFDKPTIHMWYFASKNKCEVHDAVRLDFSSSFHNRRLLSYGGICVAKSRQELIEAIQRGIADPQAKATERARSIEYECGALDGQACERVAELLQRKNADRERAEESGGKNDI